MSAEIIAIRLGVHRPPIHRDEVARRRRRLRQAARAGRRTSGHRRGGRAPARWRVELWSFVGDDFHGQHVRRELCRLRC